MRTAIGRAIRRTWPRKDRRKNCAAKANSWVGSAKAPVTGCIAMEEVTAASASTSGSCSLRGASPASSAGIERVDIAATFG
eukprot:scaffold6847_cov64-Phaeocystis_antarctica.AAC.8